MPDTAADLIKSYERGKDCQAKNNAFEKTAAYSFLEDALDQKFEDMTKFLWVSLVRHIAWCKASFLHPGSQIVLTLKKTHWRCLSPLLFVYVKRNPNTNKHHIAYSKKRRIFSMHVVAYKITLMSTSVHHDGRWACLWEHSAFVPTAIRIEHPLFCSYKHLTA